MATILPRHPTVGNLTSVLPQMRDKSTQIETSLREQEAVLDDLKARTTQLTQLTSDFESAIYIQGSKVACAYHHLSVLKRQADQFHPLTVNDKHSCLQVEQVYQQLRQNLSAVAVTGRGVNLDESRIVEPVSLTKGMCALPIQVPSPHSTPFLRHLLHAVRSIGDRLVHLERLLAEVRSASEESDFFIVSEVRGRGTGIRRSGNKDILMIVETLETQRDVLLILARKALNLSETAEELHEAIERSGVEILLSEGYEDLEVSAATNSEGVIGNIGVLGRTSLWKPSIESPVGLGDVCTKANGIGGCNPRVVGPGTSGFFGNGGLPVMFGPNFASRHETTTTCSSIDKGVKPGGDQTSISQFRTNAAVSGSGGLFGDCSGGLYGAKKRLL